MARIASQMSCPGCWADDAQTLMDIGPVPVSCAKLFATREAALRSAVCRLDIAVCSQCAHIWNRAFRESDHPLYDDDYYSSFTKSPQAREYQDSLAGILATTVGVGGKTVLEIGCGDGYFLEALTELGAKAIGYEPSSTFSLASQRPGLEVVNEFFPFGGFAGFSSNIDVVVMRHVLEHMASPRQVLTSLRCQSFPGHQPEFLLLEVPNAHQLLVDDLYFDFYNDHVQYFSRASLDSLARSTGWTPIVQSEKSAEFLCSIFVSGSGSPPAAAKYSGTPARWSKDTVLAAADGFRQNFMVWKTSLLDAVAAEQAEGRRIAVWGAGARGTALLAGLGERASSFAYVVDSDPNKAGKHLPMTGLPVLPVEWLEREPVQTVLITSYTYFGEIFEQLEWFRSKGGRVMRVYPTPEVVA